MQHPVGVTVSHPAQYLPHEIPHHPRWQSDPLPYIVAPLPLVHVSLEIVRDVLEDEVKTAGRGLYDVQKLDDVVVRQFSEEGYLPDDIAGDTALGGRVGVRDALDSDRPVRGALSSSVDRAVCALPNQIRPVISIVQSVPTNDHQTDPQLEMGKVDNILV